MSLFDFFRKKCQQAEAATPSPAPAAPAPTSSGPYDSSELRELLFDAAASEDLRPLVDLCRANREAILRHVPEWKVVPEPLRKDRAAVQRWGSGLIRVAQAFEEELGDDSLIRSFESSDEDNPLSRWQRELAEARQLTESLRYDEAKELLTNLLIDVRSLMAFGTTSLSGMTHGQLGACLFNKGEAADALPHFERALALCEEQGDAEGVLAYSGALYEVHRYLGQGGSAADAAERRARQLHTGGRKAEAAEWVEQARRVRAAEPLNRVVAVVQGRRYELDRLDELSTGPKPVRVQFQFVRNRLALGLSQALTEEGGRLGGQGKYYEALDVFRRAAKVDPFNPQPRYEEAVTLMHLERPAEAAESLAETERLAPGWYNCRGDRWLAERIAAGEVPHAVFMLLRLEDLPAEADDLRQRIELAEAAVGQLPDLAPLHLFRGRALLAADRKVEAQEALRAGLACAAEPDVRTRLLVNLHAVAASSEERKRLLEEAASLGETGNRMAAAMAAVSLRLLV